MYFTNLNCSAVSEFLEVISYFGAGMDQEEELGDEKDSDSIEIWLDVEMDYASQIINTFTFCVF